MIAYTDDIAESPGQYLALRIKLIFASANLLVIYHGDRACLISKARPT